jgi:putative ABC transport system permease protein
MRHRWLLPSLALQNLGRRKARTLLLIAAVALGSGVVFTGAILMQSIQRSMEAGFTRLGADLMVVPEGALTNITASLLVVEPSELVLDADALAKARIASLGRVAAQKIVRVEHSGIGSHHESADLIGFEPAQDFTVQPWLSEKLNRPMRPGDVILGAARDGVLGSELLIFGKPHIIYGRLGRTGVGTHERGVFMSFATLDVLSNAISGHGAKPAVLAPGKVTGFLAELAPGATPLQARFAILSNVKGVKVVSGDTTLSGIRQGLAALLDGMLALVVLMFAGTALMVSVLFSAIVTERRDELGLLKAIGARRAQVLGVLVIEAVLATGLGGLLGVVLGLLAMRLFERSLVYYLENVGLPFLWVDLPRTIAFAAGAIVLASAIGVAGVLYPAWAASRRDAYDLVRGEA